MPTPVVVLPSAPVLLWIVPPVQSATTGFVIVAGVPVALMVTAPPHWPFEFPVTVKLPLVFCRVMPLLAPPLDETLTRLILKGVVLLLRVISTAVAPLLVMVPLVAVIVLVLSVAMSPR